MTIRSRVRLGLESLDARLTPAVTAFTFTLGDGTIGSGTFDYDDSLVDTTDDFQDLEFTDWSISLGGETFTDDDGFLDFGTVFLEYGEVTNTAFGAFTTSLTPGYPYEYVWVDGGQVEVNVVGASEPENASIEYMNVEAADVTFQNSDGSLGGITFDVDWADVDPDNPDQSVTVSSFSFFYNGVLYASTEYFPSSAQSHYNNGELSVLSFSLAAKGQDPAIDVTFNATGGILQVFDTINQQLLLNANADIKDKRAALNFSNVTTGRAYTLQFDIAGSDDSLIAVTIDIAATDTATMIRNKCEQALANKNVYTESEGNFKLQIGGIGSKTLTGISIVTTLNDQEGIVAPKLFQRSGAPKVLVDDVEVFPSS